MNGRITVRPPRASAIVMIVMGILFLAFGVVLVNAAEGEARPFALMFGILWVAVCVGIVVYGLCILSRGKAPAMAVIDVESAPEGGNSSEGTDFEAKLRKLERLRKERLISEEEYRRKRTEIMAEKW
jgi:hypothetical protein